MSHTDSSQNLADSSPRMQPNGVADRHSFRGIGSPFGLATRWNATAPNSATLGHINAANIQWILAGISVAFVLVWLPILLSEDLYPGLFLAATAHLGTSTVIVLSVAAIARGQVRRGAVSAVIALQISQFASADSTGLHGFPLALANAVVCVLVAGLILGRRALWTSMSMSILWMLLATTAEIIASKSILPSVLMTSIERTFVLCALTCVLDRSIQSRRTALCTAHEQSWLLEREVQLNEEMQRQLVHAQKLESIGRLATGVTHDFRNVLAIILGYSESRHRADDGLVSPAESQSVLIDSLEGVEKAARRGLELCARLLTFARPDLPRPERIDLAAFMADVGPMIGRLVGPDVTVTIGGSEVPVGARVDRSHLELMLFNVAANARDAMPAGGTITLGAKPVGGHAVVSVTDTGSGISIHDPDRAFEPFFTTKPPGVGAGLGLATVRMLMDQAGGHATISSVRGEGTTVELWLPLGETTENHPVGSHAST